MGRYVYRNGKMVYDKHFPVKRSFHSLKSYNIKKKRNMFTRQYPTAPDHVRAQALASIRKIRAARKFRQRTRAPINQFRRNLRLTPDKRIKRRY